MTISATDALLAAPLPAAYGIGNLPDIEGESPAMEKFKSYLVGLARSLISFPKGAGGSAMMLL